MNPKNNKGKRLTSTIMALMMSVSTTLTPINTVASKMESTSVAVESAMEETTAEAQVQNEIETVASSEVQTQVSEVQATTESVAEEDQTETESSVPEESQTSGECAEDTSANETRGPDETQVTETSAEDEKTAESESEIEETSEEEPTIDLSTATKEKILSYIKAIGGNESEAFYSFVGSLREDEYQLVWLAQYGVQEDQLAEKFAFNYDEASDLDIAKYLYKLSEDELIDLIESMTFDQYRRYLSIREMMAEMTEKDFSDVIDEEDFTIDRSWDYENYDVFAETLTGVSLQRTEQVMQFYNTYVDPSQIQTGVSTIDSLLNSNMDWYSNDYILKLNPELFKETVPIYYGSDGNYYVVSTVPSLNGIEAADYQPATNFYNGSVEAQAFTDIEYLGNGVYRIPSSRYQYCFTEQYVSDMGTLYGISFGLRIQVLYGFTPSGEITIAADVVYPDMTERFLPATLNLLAGTATVKIFNDEYEDTIDKYLVSASINRGASIPESSGSLNGGKSLQIVVNDAAAVGSLDVLIGYNATSKYSMAAEVTTQDLYSTQTTNADINLAAEMYNGAYLKLARESVPSNLAVGDKFIYSNTGLTIVGVNTTTDAGGGQHIGASVIPTHDSQSFCFYNGKGVEPEISSWFKTQLNTNSADPGYMVQMTTENISARASYNGTSINLGYNKIFGYVTDGLGAATGTSGNTLNLEGTNVLLSCMHAWGNESATTPQDILTSISTFTGRTQMDFAVDEGFGHYHPNVALQCTDVHDGGDGYTYATFKVVTSMLHVGGVAHAENYQCAFSTIRIAYPSAPKTGFLRIHKSSADPAMTNGNSCYKFEGIQYGIFADEACVNNIAVLSLDANGYTQPYEVPAGTYYVREADATPGSGYETNGTVYTVQVTAGTTADTPVMCETVDQPLNDPLGIRINKINGDGSTTSDLSGAEYEINYYAGDYTSVDELPEDSTYSWRIVTKKNSLATAVSDAEGNITTTATFPVGHYFMKEKSVNNQYTMSEGEIHYFNVVSYNGAAFIQYEPGNQAVIFKDRVVRGDLSFIKKNAETDEALAYIPFKITNNATGETHYILTDADGNFTSAIGKAVNTNVNDKILSQYGEKDVIPQSVIDDLAKDAGLWFGVGSEGTMTDANDSYGAFVYGTYTITELKTEATRSMKMYTNTFTIDTDGKMLDLGTVNNIPMSIRTILVDVNGEHFAETTSTVTLVDHVSYKNLDTGKTYTLTGTLYVKDGDALTELMTETVDFQPTETTGTQDVTFTFDASALVGKSVVAFEELSLNGEFCAEHKDKNDENQTVVFPGLKTTARDSQTDDHVSNADDSITIIDTVKYSGLHVGNEYTITGTLMDQKTGKAVLDDDGNEITASKVITATESDGSVEIEFQFAGVSLAGKTIVVFENLDYEGKRYAVHADLNDKNQTIYFPSIKTNATDKNTGLNQVKEDSNVTVVDTVTYTGLQPGKTYTMTGMLMSSAGNAIVSNGKRITASTEFTPIESDGNIDVVFNFDATNGFSGRQYVFYEYLYLDGVRVAAHTDVSDTNQIIYIPSIRTTLIDSENGSHSSAADQDITLIDTVRYNGVEIGRTYTVTGTLVDKATGKEIVDDAGNKINASAEFTAEKTNGTIDVTFVFSGVSLAGKTIVAYEHMYTEGKEVAVHADLRDESQTEYFPSVHTTATSNDTEDHVVGANEKVTITDQVTIKALKLGTEYTLSGTLMNAKTGKPIIVNGATITARRIFTADAHKMTISLIYTLNASELAGTKTVIFEDLYSDGALLASHADLKDAEQTVYIPEIHTTAKDKETQINHTEANKTATIIDTVFYTNLLPGKEYTMTGTLMNQETGEAVLIDGKEIIASTTFTPVSPEGSVDVIFEFDASVLAPTTVVAFENLTYKEIQIAVHADIEDAEQTVYIPKIRTNAISDDTKNHVVEAKKDIAIIDTVSYEGLEIGREYTVKGTLMDQKTGEALKVDGKKVTAETTFTAETTSGTIDVTFVFDGAKLEDTVLVAYEYMYTEGKEVAVHADIEDAEQTVYIPKIRTHAKDAVTEIDHTEALEKATIIDTVSYSSLLPGKEYTVTGILMNKKTGEPVLIDGKEITASTTFTAEKSEGSVEIVFKFDASAIAGTTAVAFESIKYEGIEIAVHADIEDEDQTVYIPDVHTTATALDTKDHVTRANKDLTITDEVVLTGLKIGNEYTVKGVLMDQTTEKELKANDEIITAEVTFTADERDMTVTLTYTLDASELAGTTTVVYETLYTEGKEVGRHHEIEDEGQTVYIPEIHTTAADQETGINHTELNEQATIIDTVYYSHLLPGKEYTVHGVLVDQKTGEPVLIDGKEITASTTFTAETSEGRVDVIFTFDASILAPKTVVAFEHLEYERIEIAVHADIDDENQTVYIPQIHTTAVGEDTQDHIEKAKEDAVIVDTVSYEGLEIGREYTMRGTLVDKETGEPILVNGEKVTAEETFVAESQEGSIDIIFTFDSSSLAGKSLVAFEKLYTDEKEVAVHADITDEGQTVRIPEIHTTATDKVTGDHDGVVTAETTVLDEVFYTNLILGKEYTVKGTLVVKETGEPLISDGKEVTAEKTFVAEEPDGSIVLEFTFNSLALAGKHVVAFEDVEYEGVSIGTHADIEDEDQTISYPSIHTTAVNGTDGSKTMVLGTNVTLVDTVTYKGLTAGKTYVLKGTVMDKASGQPIGVTAEATFTAEATDGSTVVTFTFDTTVLQGKTLVVFESLYDAQGNLIADHSDINDEDQTVSIPVQPEIPPVVTGDNSTPMPYVAGLTVALLAAVAITIMLIRRKKQA